MTSKLRLRIAWISPFIKVLYVLPLYYSHFLMSIEVKRQVGYKVCEYTTFSNRKLA